MTARRGDAADCPICRGNYWREERTFTDHAEWCEGLPSRLRGTLLRFLRHWPVSWLWKRWWHWCGVGPWTHEQVSPDTYPFGHAIEPGRNMRDGRN